MEAITRKELVNELNMYRGVLSDSVIQYLNSLIALKVSVVRKNENVTDVQRKILSEIDIYKNIAIYNIMARASAIFARQKESGNFVGGVESDSVFYGIKLSGDYKFGPTTNLFWFELSEVQKEIPDGYKTMQMGKIRLYKTIWSEEKRNLEIDRIKKELTDLQSEYENSDNESYRKRYVIPDSIRKYESILAELENRHKLNETQAKAIEITSRIHDTFMNDYGLNSNDFEETQKERKCRLTGDMFMQEYKQESEMEKVFVKKYPNLTIENYITYL